MNETEFQEETENFVKKHGNIWGEFKKLLRNLSTDPELNKIGAKNYDPDLDRINLSHVIFLMFLVRMKNRIVFFLILIFLFVIF
jgi:hypothetical protein